MAKKTKVKEIKNERELASVLAVSENGKTQANIGDVRQIIKLLKAADRKATLDGVRGPLVMLRKLVLASVVKK